MSEDTEILDGIAKAIFESENPDVEWTAPYTRKTARAVMAELDRRGCVFARARVGITDVEMRDALIPKVTAYLDTPNGAEPGDLVDSILAELRRRGWLPTWTECSDKMPPDDLFVSTYGTCHRGQLIAAWDEERKGWFSYDGDPDCCCDVITHWALLLAPPATTSKEKT